VCESNTCRVFTYTTGSRAVPHTRLLHHWLLTLPSAHALNGACPRSTPKSHRALRHSIICCAGRPHLEGLPCRVGTWSADRNSTLDLLATEQVGVVRGPARSVAPALWAVSCTSSPTISCADRSAFGFPTPDKDSAARYRYPLQHWAHSMALWYEAQDRWVDVLKDGSTVAE